MQYKGTDLILDNLRKELSEYSVDVQDVVRSAILDGIDIGDYIEPCKNNPYRLDQIRLGIKEDLNKVFFNIKSGQCLYKIRKLDKVSLVTVASKMKSEALSDDSLEKLIDWASAGYNLTDIKVSIIPKTLYDVFEQGLQKGFDMKVFNTGKNYKPDYIRYCLIIMFNGKDITTFVNGNSGLWSEDSLKQLAVFSRIKSSDKWNSLVKYISPQISSEKVGVLISCVKNGINISQLCKDEWSEEGIRYILKAFENGVDYASLISIGPDEDTVMSKLNEMLLRKNKKISGRFRKS